MAYLDDIIVFSLTVEQMIEHLRIVFGRLRNAGLKLKAKKCTLFQTETIYLGHVISAEGVSCDPAKVSAVKRCMDVFCGLLASFLGGGKRRRISPWKSGRC